VCVEVDAYRGVTCALLMKKMAVLRRCFNVLTTLVYEILRAGALVLGMNTR